VRSRKAARQHGARDLPAGHAPGVHRVGYRLAHRHAPSLVILMTSGPCFLQAGRSGALVDGSIASQELATLPRERRIDPPPAPAGTRVETARSPINGRTEPALAGSRPH